MQPEQHPNAAAAQAPQIEGISAVSLATHDVARSVRFDTAPGFVLRCGGATAAFSSLAAGPCSVNLIARPAEQRWSWWGRVIFDVADVDALYRHALALGLWPDPAPRDAPWGERFFHRTDPDGHELSFARPLATTGRPGE
jgi:hypothetical protein